MRDCYSERYLGPKKLKVEAKRDAERLRLQNGAVILYKARELTLRFREAHSRNVYEEDSELVIQGRGLRGSPEIVESKAKKILERHLKAQAEIVLIPRAHELAEKMGLGQRLTQVGLRKTKSKWGHCTSTGVLQLNWLIMLAPNAVVDVPSKRGKYMPSALFRQSATSAA